MDPARLTGHLPMPADAGPTGPIEEPTEELNRLSSGSGPSPKPAPRKGFLAGLAGVCAIALVLMPIVLVAALLFSHTRGMPGPHPVTIWAQVVGGVVAIPLYRLATTRLGPVRLVCGLALPVLFVLLLWLFWWST
jgi:hypothetical protein